PRKCRSSVTSATPRSPRSTRAPARSSAWSSPAKKPGCAEPRHARPRKTGTPVDFPQSLNHTGPVHLRGPHCIRTQESMNAAKKKPSPARRRSNPRGKTSIEPILEALRKRAPKAMQAQAEAFAKAFYVRMSDDEMVQHSAEGWANLAWDFLEQARKRKPG